MRDYLYLLLHSVIGCQCDLDIHEGRWLATVGWRVSGFVRWWCETRMAAAENVRCLDGPVVTECRQCQQCNRQTRELSQTLKCDYLVPIVIHSNSIQCSWPSVKQSLKLTHMCTTKTLSFDDYFRRHGVYDTPLCKSGLAPVRPAESYGRAALASHCLSAVHVYKQVWSMSEWRFMNEWVMTGRGWARTCGDTFGQGTAPRPAA